MNRNVWFSRQFGDTSSFALRVSLSSGPRDEVAWGALELWAAGLCLTRATHHEDGTTTDAVEGDLGEVFSWFARAGVRLVNEEPLPLLTPRTVTDASDWFNETEECFDAADERAWFARRSEWRNSHGLRRASLAIALPNVAFRRAGDELEISWDNETWGTSHPGLRYTELRGAVTVAARPVAEVLEGAGAVVRAAIVERLSQAPGFELVRDVSEPGWRWLLPAETFAALDPRQRSALAADFATCNGLYFPHTETTRVLARARARSPEEVRVVLEAARLPDRPMSERLRALVRPSRPARVRPWKAGYDAAEEVREELAWGDEPAPPLAAWLREEQVDVRPLAAGGLTLIARRSDARGGAIAVDASSGAAPFRYATALGHLLLDGDGLAIDGAAESSPAAARARAFAAMLLLPDGAARAATQNGPFGLGDARALAARSSLSVLATVQHLENRGFLSPEARTALDLFA